VFSVAHARASNDFVRHPALSFRFIGGYSVRPQMQSWRAFASKLNDVRSASTASTGSALLIRMFA
jgi:hypothetical protein